MRGNKIAMDNIRQRLVTQFGATATLRPSNGRTIPRETQTAGGQG